VTVHPDAAPTVVTHASASPNLAPFGGSIALSVLGDDDGGESRLTYTWIGLFPFSTFSNNGTNSAKNTTVRFGNLAGTFTLEVRIFDGTFTTIDSVVVTVMANDPPTVAVAASASPNPAPFASPITLSVLGADANDGEAALTYRWEGGVFAHFGTNGTNAAKNTTVNFGGFSGTFTITVTISDGLFSTTSSVVVTVEPNIAPVVATPAAADPNPTTVGTSTSLSVLGDDANDGEAALRYFWQMDSGPGSVVFSANGNNAAKNTTATFSVAGTYTITVLILDLVLATPSTVVVTVN
jgi:hypothetical protein